MKARVFSAYIKDVDKKCVFIDSYGLVSHLSTGPLPRFGARNFRSTLSVVNIAAPLVAGSILSASLRQAMFWPLLVSILLMDC